MLLNDSAAGKQHAREVRERDRAYALAVQREVDEDRKEEESALLKNFEQAREDKSFAAATVALGDLMETAIDFFAPSDKPNPTAF